MQIAQMIEALAGSGPLNVVWGAGCSYAGPEGERTLISELRFNHQQKVSKPQEIHQALLNLTPEKRLSATRKYGVDWAHVCLAELLRTGRVARVLTTNFDDGILKGITVAGILPELYDRHFPELSKSATPCIYSLGETGSTEVAGLIERGAQIGPWLIVGSSGHHFGLANALRSVPRFEHALYWAGYLAEATPEPVQELFTSERNAHFLTGFDAASLMAYLVRGLGEFPPAFIAKNCTAVAKTPGEQLYRWIHPASDGVYRIRDSFLNKARQVLTGAGALRGEAYETAVAEGIWNWENYLRWSPGIGHAAASSLRTLAEKQTPREAQRLLAKALAFQADPPTEDLSAVLHAAELARVYLHLARYRTGPSAAQLFAKGEAALAVAPNALPGYGSAEWAKLLAAWAGQEQDSQSMAIFERAREKFREVCTINPKLEPRFEYAQALLHAASWADRDHALEWLSEARELAQGDQPGVLQFLGILSLVRARKDLLRTAELVAEAARHFQRAIELLPPAAGDLLGCWAAALGELAMERQGREALQFYAAADQKFRESEAAGRETRALRKNWSSVLLREARERGGPPELWDRARRQAERADEIDPGSGAYNLACIAAESGDGAAVEAHLVRSAEHGQIMPLSHIRRDINFQTLLGEPWFEQLLADLFCYDPHNFA